MNFHFDKFTKITCPILILIIEIYLRNELFLLKYFIHYQIKHDFNMSKNNIKINKSCKYTSSKTSNTNNKSKEKNKKSI